MPRLAAPDGLRPAGEQAHEGGLARRRLDDAAALAARGGVQEAVRQPDHLAQPVHHNHLQLGAGRTRCLSGNCN